MIEDEEIIKKILKHLGLWDQKARPPPKLKPLAERNETLIDESFSQLPMPARRLCGGSDNLSRGSRSTLRLSIGRSNEWLYVDIEYPEEYSA